MLKGIHGNTKFNYKFKIDRNFNLSRKKIIEVLNLITNLILKRIDTYRCMTTNRT